MSPWRTISKDCPESLWTQVKMMKEKSAVVKGWGTIIRRLGAELTLLPGQGSGLINITSMCHSLASGPTNDRTSKDPQYMSESSIRSWTPQLFQNTLPHTKGTGGYPWVYNLSNRHKILIPCDHQSNTIISFTTVHCYHSTEMLIPVQPHSRHRKRVCRSPCGHTDRNWTTLTVGEHS